MGFYTNYRQLCQKKGVSPSAAAMEMGLNKSTVTRWKGGGSPSNENLLIIAEYFNVSVSYLLGEEKEKPTMTGEHISEARKQLDAALDDMSDEELLFLMSKIKAIKNMRG